MTEQPALRLQEATVAYPGPRAVIGHRATIALDRVTLAVEAGVSLGVIGDSSAGKTTLARLMAGLVKPASGTIWVSGTDLTGAPERQWREARRHIGFVFQDALRSFNPMHSVEHALTQPLRSFSVMSRAERKQTVGEIMERVGLRASQMTRYPHEFSGGQIQRLAVARALITRPSLVVLDEPVSSLDVSIRAQVLNLFRDLAADFSLTYVLIGSDPSVVGHMAKRVVIMYAGRVVESGRLEDVYSRPRHPYSSALLRLRSHGVSADATPQLSATRLASRRGATWDGCPFAGICPLEAPRCAVERPEMVEVGPGHGVTCHAYAPGDQAPPAEAAP